MKPTIFLTIFISAIQTLKADNSIRLNSSIENITIFRRGAEVNNLAKGNVPSGKSEIIFHNLPSNINDKTIQVACRNDITILSVNFQLNYLNTKSKFPELIRLEDSLEMINDARTKLMNEKMVLMGESKMLEENRKIGGANTGVNISELKIALALYNTRLTEINAQYFKIDKSEKILNEQIQRIQNQINSYNQKINQPTGEIVLQVMSKNAMSANFHFSYLVNDAGWTPMYDLRAESIKGPVDLVYKANVYQNTGNDWNNVKLTISTGNPSENGTNPTMNTWWIDFYNPIRNISGGVPAKYGDTESLNIKGSRSDGNQYIIDGVKVRGASSVNDYTIVNENQLAAEFEIDLPYSIPSDGKTHTVAMKEYSLPATYQYYAVPKLDKDAFLLAKITDWEKLNLLNGTANIFFENTYVGQTQINTSATKDTLSFSLGRDKKINIKREKIKDFTSSKVIGLNKKETYAYEFSVRNTKNEPVDIEIFDQIPVSQNKEIIIELEESGNAEFNAENGELKWRHKIDPAKATVFKMIYSVKYPKDKQIPRL